MNEHYPEEGDPCALDGCEGRMGYKPVIDCRCHVRPPCRVCTENPLVCLECGYDPEEEQ